MRSVLVVDDDPELRKPAGRLLAARGLAVVGEAGSVAAALAAADRLKPTARHPACQTQIHNNESRRSSRRTSRRAYGSSPRVSASAEAIYPHVTDHLGYMATLEREGGLRASGPFVVPGVLVGDGLTILRADTEDEASAIMTEEPLTKLGPPRYELHLSELREGRITVQLGCSESSFGLV
jgi:uncharacterized protein